jgi:3-oxoacyl-[acyl-carrier protein] reductase
MSNTNTPLQGKVAVVTGANRGIGRAVAGSLAELGATVYLCARDEAKLHSATEELITRRLPAKAVRLDVTDEQQWQSLAQRVRNEHNRLDILINNAGVGAFGKPLHETSTEDFTRMVDINIKGVYLGIKCLAPLMIASGGGDIVNISSIASKNPVKNAAIYAATKWAVNGLSVSAAEELRDHRVRVSFVCPGSTATELIVGMREPNDRMLRSEDIAHAVTVIVTQAPQSFISEIVIRPTLKP